MELFIIVTKDCNFQCKYCYEKEKKFMGGNMSVSTINRVLNFFLPNLLEESDAICFFGGEPLLVFPMIKRAIKIIRNNNKKIKISVNTNGSLLDTKKFLFFIENEVDIILSLDGAPETQNLNRPPRIGAKDSYSLIVGNSSFGYLIKYPLLQVNVVISQTRVENLFNDFMHLVELGIRNINFDAERGVYWTKNKLRILKKEMEKINYYAVERRSKIKVGYLERYLERKNKKKRTVAVCPYRKRITVMPNGEIYPCNAILTVRGSDNLTGVDSLDVEILQEEKMEFKKLLRLKEKMYVDLVEKFSRRRSKKIILCDAIAAFQSGFDLKKLAENELEKSRVFAASIENMKTSNLI